MNRFTKSRNAGSSLIELLVVIVVISILAAITTIFYNGITQKAIVATIKSDLSNASHKLSVYRLDNDSYPTTNNCEVAETPPNICLTPSAGTVYTYTPAVGDNPQGFTLVSTHTASGIAYSITESNIITVYVPSVPITCPTGFIVVPGSAIYGTSDFCIMKYEAKSVLVDGVYVATSQAALTPWVFISQTLAKTKSAAACTGCHLVTEAEWLTVARDVLSVGANWSGGSVGNGYIYSGHSDSVPYNILAASTDDDGYFGTSNTAPSNQRRTLTLSNGEVIWDLAGNVWEWTQGQITGGQPGIIGQGYPAYPYFREWINLTANLNVISPNPFPFTTGLQGAETWSSSNGVGMISSSANETALHVFARGGAFPYSTPSSGVMALDLRNTPTAMYGGYGFRAAK